MNEIFTSNKSSIIISGSCKRCCLVNVVRELFFDIPYSFFKNFKNRIIYAITISIIFLL